MKIQGRRSDSRTGNHQRPRSFRADRDSASHRRALRRGAPRRAPAPPGQGCGETRSVDLLPTQAPHGGDHRARCEAPAGSFRVTAPTPATTTHLVLRPNRNGVLLDIWEAVYSPAADDCDLRHSWDRRTNVIEPEVAARREPILLAGGTRPLHSVLSYGRPSCCSLRRGEPTHQRTTEAQRGHRGKHRVFLNWLRAYGAEFDHPVVSPLSKPSEKTNGSIGATDMTADSSQGPALVTVTPNHCSDDGLTTMLEVVWPVLQL